MVRAIVRAAFLGTVFAHKAGVARASAVLKGTATVAAAHGGTDLVSAPFAPPAGKTVADAIDAIAVSGVALLAERFGAAFSAPGRNALTKAALALAMTRAIVLAALILTC